MGRLDGKVAFITGAARGQGRSHAVRLAEEGADIVAVDICDGIKSVPYELGSSDELAETGELVKKAGRRVVTCKADVRHVDELSEAVAQGVSELGHLDVVVANAGIWSTGPFLDMSEETYRDMIDVQMHGAFYTCRATIPVLLDQGTGGSIIIISSTAGLKGFPGQVHYNMAKHAQVGLMRTLANEYAQSWIRVNSIHPSSTFTKMINNPAIWEVFAPGVENPTEADFGDTFASMNLLPVPWAEPVDISHAVVYLASDESRYVTGVTLPVDSGFMAKL